MALLVSEAALPGQAGLTGADGSKWPQPTVWASNGTAEMAGASVHIVSHPQKASLSLPGGGGHRSPSSRKGLAPCRAFFKSLHVLCY